MVPDEVLKSSRGGWDDVQHQKECGRQALLSGAAFCFASRLCKSDMRGFPIGTSARKKRGGLGCSVCNEVNAKDAAFMSMFRVDKHHFC